MSQFHGPLPAMGDLLHAMQEGISTYQASKRQADCAGYPGGWSGPILSAGWGQGTWEKDVRPHLCSSTSPQSVRPRTTLNPSGPEQRLCVVCMESQSMHGVLELIFSGFQARLPSVGRISQKLPLASMAHE